MALTDRPRPGWNSRPGTGPVQRARGHGPRAPHTRHSPCSPAHSPCSAPRPHAPTSRLDHGTPGRGEAAATLTPHTWTPHGHRADEPSEGLRSGLDGSLRADPEGPGSRTRGPDWLGPARLGPARPPPRQARPTTHHPTPLFRHADHDQRARSTAPSGKLALRSIPPAHCPHTHSPQHGQDRPYHGSRRAAHTALGPGPASGPTPNTHPCGVQSILILPLCKERA